MDPIDDVVVGGQQVAEDGDDARFGFVGQLDLDGGAPLFAAVVLREDDAVGRL